MFRVHKVVHSSQLFVTRMGAVTFDREQVRSIGAISLHEFAVCLTFALASMGSAAERMLTPLAHGLFGSVIERALLEEARPYHAGRSAAAPTSCIARHAPLAAASARLAHELSESSSMRGAYPRRRVGSRLRSICTGCAQAWTRRARWRCPRDARRRDRGALCGVLRGVLPRQSRSR